MKTSLIIPKNNIYFISAGVIKSSTKSPISFAANNIANVSSPDLKQYDIPEVGEYYCGPVSAANAVIMLSQNGFPNLYRGSESSALINDLAKYFKTDKQGTTSDNMCKGIEAFVEARGYKCKLNYQGFRPVDARYKTASLPDLNWIKNETNKHNAVFLNIGVYKKTVQGGKTIYTRHYGHFVNVTGSGNNCLSIDPNYLTIRDPYNRVEGDHYIKVIQINEGKLIHNPDDNEVSLTDNAAGFYEISSKFNYFAPDEVAIINGVISMEVEK